MAKTSFSPSTLVAGGAKPARAIAPAVPKKKKQPQQAPAPTQAAAPTQIPKAAGAAPIPNLYLGGGGPSSPIGGL